MKKLALLALAAPALAGTPAPVVAAAPAPAPAPCCTNLELGFGYNFAAKDLRKHFMGSSKEVDTVGIDLTAVHRLTDNHALTLRIAGTQGSEISRMVTDSAYSRTKDTLRTFSVMPGYRYTTAVSEKTSLFCGVNVGVVNQDIHQTQLGAWDVGGTMWPVAGDKHADAWGIGATVEAGVRYQICPCTEIFAAYQFSGNTAKCKEYGTTDFDGIRTHRQIHNGVRAGFTFKF